MESISSQHQAEILEARDEALKNTTQSLHDVEAKVAQLQEQLQKKEMVNTFLHLYFLCSISLYNVLLYLLNITVFVWVMHPYLGNV